MEAKIRKYNLNSMQVLLKGISIKDGVPSALINDHIYQKGDTFEGYRIVNIDIRSITLENLLTKEISSLFLPPTVQY